MRTVDIVLGRDDTAAHGKEMLGLAKQLAGDHEKIRILFPVGCNADIQEQLAPLSSELVFFTHTQVSAYSYEGILSMLWDFWAKETPGTVLMPDSGFWRSVAPALAFKLKGVYGAAIRDIRQDGKGTSFGRHAWSGRRMVWLRMEISPVVLTIPAGCFASASPMNDPASIRFFSPRPPAEKVSFEGEEAGGGAAVGLRDARIVLAAGRGIEKPATLDVVRQLGEWLPGSLIAGSRPVCDNGWIPYDRQIGETGADVAPELYMALGVSGASQHLSGMKRSGFVVVINREKTAPFFQHADIGIVEDLNLFLAVLLEQLDG
ncbi:electron transfer flavoprotein subunit alpha/FixB family protein [Desulfobotulus sp. H1]|uniref:Electron transfer flavoprotein subunit alpha/FixB family protein n=1 Tax=Desulfobotulus pelophilus TaxID=2823377 RepID=A0ABT3N8A2_9BACT|nr:electron transfer flavoprotein subunit alpha/FixB family protein [Desulfobotulus pelophilus]MCW7753680.1 electron transfer flavoprotein subunit alpha/FixB family protein [Desulfobotulus pelophilus]